MKYAGFWRRLVAISIDQFLIGLAAFLVASAAAVVALYLPPISQVKSNLFFDYALFAGYAVIGLVYFGWLEGKTGVTIGKRLVNLKLILIDQPNRDGIGVSRALLRSSFVVVQFIAFALMTQYLEAAFMINFLFAVNFSLILLSRQRRTLHDDFFKTGVVYDPSEKFPAFDPDKLPLRSRRRVLFAVVIILYSFAAVGQIVYFSGLTQVR